MAAMPVFLRGPLEDFRRLLRAKFGERVRDVRLFGSYARGEASEDSDIDVLVLIDGLTPMEQWDAAGVITPILLETGLPFSALPMSTEHFEELRRRERLLARDIDREGISL